MSNFTFKLLLSLPLLLLLWETFVNIYYMYFDFSFIVQVLLVLLWSVEMWWVLKTGDMPLPVIVTAFVVTYIGFIVDSPLRLRVYVGNALWAVLYTYLLRGYHLRSSKNERTANTQETSFSSGA